MNWKCLKIHGPLDFAQSGILSSLATPLATAGISIFGLSTYDTDYVMVRDNDLERAVETLTQSGHQVHTIN